jgi:hypothetical protein
LLELEFGNLDPVGQRIVANRLLERLAGWIPPRRDEPPIQPMTELEADRFERDTMHFGKHAGEKFSDIDVDYLAWLADASRDLWRKLHAYLRSDADAKELEE